LFGALSRAFGVLPLLGGVNGRYPLFAREPLDLELSRGFGEFIGRFPVRLALFEFDGVIGRFPGAAGPRASRGEIAGAR